MSQQQVVANSAVPKHEQLRRILLDLCVTELHPGDMLPSERKLVDAYGVSRITVREAVGQLVADGVLERAPGKGTFVARTPLRSDLHLASFHEDMRRAGARPSTRVVTAAEAVPPPHVAEALHLPPAQKAYHVKRLRLANELPISVDDGWYSPVVLPGLLREDLSQSLYELLAERFGVLINQAEQTVSASAANPVDAELLKIHPADPVLVFDRVSRCDGQPVEVARSTYRGDRYQLRMHLDGSSWNPSVNSGQVS